ncbi:unnamed protein product [Jaminaea pallidilutea]
MSMLPRTPPKRKAAQPKVKKETYRGSDSETSWDESVAESDEWVDETPVKDQDDDDDDAADLDVKEETSSGQSDVEEYVSDDSVGRKSPKKKQKKLLVNGQVKGGEQGTADDKPEVKSKAIKNGKIKGEQTSPSKSAPKFWSQEETLELWRAMFRMALNDVSAIKAAAKSSRNVGHVGQKLRGEIKKRDKELGGDGEWVATYRKT